MRTCEASVQAEQMIQKLWQSVLAMAAVLALASTARPAFAQGERFEIMSIKAVRPTLVNTIRYSATSVCLGANILEEVSETRIKN